MTLVSSTKRIQLNKVNLQLGRRIMNLTPRGGGDDVLIRVNELIHRDRGVKGHR